MKILDWYSHQGHQYEFFKLDHDFFLLDRSGRLPEWNSDHRPRNVNVSFCDLSMILDCKFDIVMYRNSSDEQLVEIMKSRGSKIIYVSQTVFDPMPKVKPDAIVWNSIGAMIKFSKNHACESFDIVHGYDPKEFRFDGADRNGKCLTVSNHFKDRGDLLGFDMWKYCNKNIKGLDLYGHGNGNLGLGRIKNFKEHIDILNNYSVYLNTTTHSAMPRSRAEAMMCGMPLVTTKNWGIEKYIRDDECFFVRSKEEACNAINNILSNDSLRDRLSKASRDCAIREFSLNKYKKSWNKVFERVL